MTDALYSSNWNMLPRSSIDDTNRFLHQRKEGYFIRFRPPQDVLGIGDNPSEDEIDRFLLETRLPLEEALSFGITWTSLTNEAIWACNLMFARCKTRIKSWYDWVMHDLFMRDTPSLFFRERRSTKTKIVISPDPRHVRDVETLHGTEATVIGVSKMAVLLETDINTVGCNKLVRRTRVPLPLFFNMGRKWKNVTFRLSFKACFHREFAPDSKLGEEWQWQKWYWCNHHQRSIPLACQLLQDLVEWCRCHLQVLNVSDFRGFRCYPTWLQGLAGTLRVLHFDVGGFSEVTSIQVIGRGLVNLDQFVLKEHHPLTDEAKRHIRFEPALCPHTLEGDPAVLGLVSEEVLHQWSSSVKTLKLHELRNYEELEYLTTHLVHLECIELTTGSAVHRMPSMLHLVNLASLVIPRAVIDLRQVPTQSLKRLTLTQCDINCIELDLDNENREADAEPRVVRVFHTEFPQLKLLTICDCRVSSNWFNATEGSERPGHATPKMLQTVQDEDDVIVAPSLESFVFSTNTLESNRHCAALLDPFKNLDPSNVDPTKRDRTLAKKCPYLKELVATEPKFGPTPSHTFADHCYRHNYDRIRRNLSTWLTMQRCNTPLSQARLLRVLANPSSLYEAFRLPNDRDRPPWARHFHFDHAQDDQYATYLLLGSHLSSMKEGWATPIDDKGQKKKRKMESNLTNAATKKKSKS